MTKSIRETRCKTLCVNNVVFIVPGFFFISIVWVTQICLISRFIFHWCIYFTNFKLLGFQFDAFLSIYIGLYWMIYYCGVDPIHCAAIATWNFKSIKKDEIRIHIVECSQCVRGENEKDSHMKWSFCEKKIVVFCCERNGWRHECGVCANGTISNHSRHWNVCVGTLCVCALDFQMRFPFNDV